MIEDKIEADIKKMDVNKQNAENLANLVRKAMSLTDKLILKVSKDYDEKNYSLIVNMRPLIGIFGDPYVSLIGFMVEPITDNNGTLRGISINTGIPKGEISSKSYNLAKDFAKKFEEKYLGQYKIEIITHL